MTGIVWERQNWSDPDDPWFYEAASGWGAPSAGEMLVRINYPFPPDDPRDYFRLARVISREEILASNREDPVDAILADMLAECRRLVWQLLRDMDAARRTP